jgi:light-regulated signal transduction histidine kinase (bacteriophytochrome)
MKAVEGSDLRADHAQRVIELEKALSISESALKAALRELDDVTRFLSHDLRAPLRGIDGYSQALIEEYGDRLDAVGQAYLAYIYESSRLASTVLEKLIHYIRAPRAALEIEAVNLSDLAQELMERLQYAQPHRVIAWVIMPGMIAQTDFTQVRILLECLLENAWKFTAKHAAAHLEVGKFEQAGETVYFVRDDGAGFNMAYQDKLFQPFQRLHSAYEFEGAGMGLAVAKRIVERLGGRIWAQGEVEKGATLFFTLGKQAVEQTDISTL